MAKHVAKSRISRKCGDCSACCEGWHTANIDGTEMYPGRPCKYFQKNCTADSSCTIYEFRPEDPCRSYSCAWLSDEGGSIPEWMRPDISGVLIDVRQWPGGDFFEFRETSKPMDANTLAWIYEFGSTHGLNIRIRISGWWHTHGTPEFHDFARVEFQQRF